jgi:hypothetical protein
MSVHFSVLGIIFRVLRLKFFLTHWEGGMVFLLSPWPLETIRGCVSLKKQKSQGKAVEVTANSKKCF